MKDWRAVLMAVLGGGLVFIPGSDIKISNQGNNPEPAIVKNYVDQNIAALIEVLAQYVKANYEIQYIHEFEENKDAKKIQFLQQAAESTRSRLSYMLTRQGVDASELEAIAQGRDAPQLRGMLRRHDFDLNTEIEVVGEKKSRPNVELNRIMHSEELDFIKPSEFEEVIDKIHSEFTKVYKGKNKPGIILFSGNLIPQYDIFAIKKENPSIICVARASDRHIQINLEDMYFFLVTLARKITPEWKMRIEKIINGEASLPTAGDDKKEFYRALSDILLYRNLRTAAAQAHNYNTQGPQGDLIKAQTQTEFIDNLIEELAHYYDALPEHMLRSKSAKWKIAYKIFLEEKGRAAAIAYGNPIYALSQVFSLAVNKNEGHVISEVHNEAAGMLLTRLARVMTHSNIERDSEEYYNTLRAMAMMPEETLRGYAKTVIRLVHDKPLWEIAGKEINRD